MKHLFFFILFISLNSWVSFAQHVQPAERSLVIVNGMFFKEKPEPFPCNRVIRIGVLKDSVFGKISVTQYEPMSENAKRFALPAESIERGEKILAAARQLNMWPISPRCPSLKLNIGDRFPDFSVSDNQGNLWTKAKLKGRRVVLNFWFTGCEPCRKEMPELGSWVNQFPDILFIAVTFERAEQIKDVIRENNFYFHQWIEADELMKTVGIGQYPTTILLDEKGQVSSIEFGTTPVQRERIFKWLENPDKK